MTATYVPHQTMNWKGLQGDFDQIKVGDTVLGASDLPGSTTASTVTTATLGVGVAPGTAAFVKVAAGTTAKAQINLASSTAPTAPNDGDVWFDGTALKIRIGGATKTVTVA